MQKHSSHCHSLLRHIRAYSRKEGHACDFSEKGGKRAKYFKIWAKMYKIRKYLEKGSLICPTIPHMKQLEYALHSQIIHNHHI